MADWRWVTSVRRIAAVGTPPIIEGKWIDFDGLDEIMPLEEGRYQQARTRLGWMTANGWQYMLIAEITRPTHTCGGGRCLGKRS